MGDLSMGMARARVEHGYGPVCEMARIFDGRACDSPARDDFKNEFHAHYCLRKLQKRFVILNIGGAIRGKPIMIRNT